MDEGPPTDNYVINIEYATKPRASLSLLSNPKLRTVLGGFPKPPPPEGGGFLSAPEGA